MQRRPHGWRLRIVAAAAVLAACVGGGAAFATGLIATHDGGTPIVGCAKDGNGQLRIVSDESQCLPSEHGIRFPGPQGPRSALVDCAKGQSVNQTLARFADDPEPLTITIKGTCTEAVRVARDDVVLQAYSDGDGVRAPSGGDNAVTLDGADRIQLLGLTLTGGQDTLAAVDGSTFGAANLHVTGAGDDGILVNSGADGTISGATVAGSRYGVDARQGASLTLAASTVSGSLIFGVHAEGGGDVDLEKGVVVTGSGFHGVVADTGGSVTLANTTVEASNGTGVFAFSGGSAFVRSGAVVQGNQQGGLGANAGTAQLDGGMVTGNSRWGVLGYNGGRVTIQNGATVESNAGAGVLLTGGSTLVVQGSTINRNSGNGIDLHDTSTALFGDGGNQIGGNGGWGIFCEPAPAVAMISPGPGIGTVSGNGAGEVSCPTA